MSTRNTEQFKPGKRYNIPFQLIIVIVCLLCTTTLDAAGALRKCDPLSLQIIKSSSIPIPVGAYDVQEIPSLGGDQDIAYGINNAGQVVGFSKNGPGCCAQAFRFTPPAIEYWPYGPITYGHAINDAGVIAGENDISGGGGGYQAFYSSATSNITHLGTLPGYSYSYGFGINNGNEVAGAAYNISPPQRAVLFSNGQAIDLGNLTDGGASLAVGINDSTEVVGWAEPANFTPTYWTPGNAFIWQANSGMLDLNEPRQVTLLGAGTFVLRKATAINNNHQIVGFATSDQLGVIRAYLLTRTRVSPLIYQFSDLGTFENGGISYALAVNSFGVAVGAAYDDASGIGNYRAAVFTGGRVVRLNDTLDRFGDFLHWDLREATGINDNGEIVGWGLHDGQWRAFKLIPRAHIEVTGDLVVDPKTHRLKAVLTVNGSRFSAQSAVEVEVRRPTSTLPIAHAVVMTDSFGDFSWSTTVPCGTNVTAMAWDQSTGAWSNAATINISCFPSA